MMTMAKFPLVRQLLSLAANVPSSSGTAMHDAKRRIADVMSTPGQFSKTFHACTVDQDEDDGVDGKPMEEAEGIAWSSSGTDLAQITQGMPRCLAAFAEILYNVYVGVRQSRQLWGESVGMQYKNRWGRMGLSKEQRVEQRVGQRVEQRGEQRVEQRVCAFR